MKRKAVRLERNMKRQLKFRAWDKLAKQFTYPDKGYQGHYILTLNGKFHNLQNGSGGDEYVVQQWTGLKDSKDVEIYEGDIIQYNANSSYDNMDFEVKFSEEELGWIFQSKTGEVLVNQWTPNGNRFNLIEVVGHIFEQ